MTGRLIVLDDEETFCKDLNRVGAECGYEVFATTDEERFLDAVANSPPTLVIVDLLISAAEGVRVLRRLSGLRVSAPVLLVSDVGGRVLDAAVAVGRERGLNIVGAMTKPLDLAELRDRLARVYREQTFITATELRDAIDNGCISLAYQPIVNMATGGTYSVEALARWEHPKAGPVSPSVFVPLAERYGLISALTKVVSHAAFAEAARWRKEGHDWKLALNVSALDLNYDFPRRLLRRCESAGLDPSALIIEVTESVTHTDILQLAEVLTALRLKGCLVSLDDFGTAYSSLVKLRRLPFSSLKIDRTFVSGVATSREDGILVDTILGMGRNLELTVVAEGVESPEIWDALVARGCQYAQGHFISEPVTAERLTDVCAGFAMHGRDRRRDLPMRLVTVA